jgi:hypothetical protein
MKITIIKEKTNGWTGLAKQTIKLQSAVLDGHTYYQVTDDCIGSKYDCKTYRTLKGAEKRYNFLANCMVVK